MWFNHLETVQENRAKGAKKAAATRKKKKAADRVEKANQRNMCHVCEQDEPPDNGDEIGTKSVLWIGCDTCLRWFHVVCVSFTGPLPSEWHCPTCR